MTSAAGKPASYTDRKALLVMRAELDRARISLSVQEVRALVIPHRNAERIALLRPKAAVAVAVATAVFGGRRVARLLRVASWALVGVRIAQNWQRGP